MVQKSSYFDPGGTLKGAYDHHGNNFRLRDSVSVVQDYYTHFRAIYNNLDLPTQIVYYRGYAQQVTEVVFDGDIGGSLNNKYFTIYSPQTDQKYHVWYNVDGNGVDPTPSGSIGIEVVLSSNDNSHIVTFATKLVINNLYKEVFTASNVSTNKLTFLSVLPGSTLDSVDFNTGFDVSTANPGEQEQVSKVYIDYPNGATNPIWNGQELRGYTFNIFSGKFDKISSAEVESSGVGKQPVVYNVTCTTAGNEYSQLLPVGTTRFQLRSRTRNAKLQIAYSPAQSGTVYMTIPLQATYKEENLQIGSTNRTVYFQANRDNTIVELIVWF